MLADDDVNEAATCPSLVEGNWGVPSLERADRGREGPFERVEEDAGALRALDTGRRLVIVRIMSMSKGKGKLSQIQCSATPTRRVA